MKKTKILLGGLSLTAIAPIMPMALTSCGCGGTTPTVEKANLTFIASEGGTISTGTKTIEVNKDTKWGDIDKPTPTAKDGYHFVGWYRSNKEMTNDTLISETMDVYAWFEKDVAGICYVGCVPGPGVSFVEESSKFFSVAGGTKWADVKDQLPTILPNDKLGDVTWYDNDTEITDDTVIQSNIFAFAWAEPKDTNTSVIQFTATTGGHLSTSKVAYPTKGTTLATVGLPTATADTGYAFGGWYINNELVDEDTEINDSCYVVAYFEKKEATFTMTAGEHGSIVGDATKSLPVGRFNDLRWELDQLAKPDDGYVLAKWVDKDGNLIDDTSRITQDMEIKAVFREQNYKFNYSETGDTCYINGIEKDVEELVIPSFTWYNGKKYSVTGIADLTYKNNTTIKFVSIPTTFTYMSSWAFEACKNMTTVVMPSTITKFWRGVFLNCSGLKEMKFCGTIAQYKATERVATWHQGVPCTSMWCTNGTTTLDDM